MVEMSFKLNAKLETGTFLIQETALSLILLSKNSLITWFLLVPKTETTEWYLLEKEQHQYLNSQICLISRFLKEHLKSDKINIATIGNIVQQMHIHIVGRKTDDCFWPDVIWGKKEFKEYDSEQLRILKESFLDFCLKNPLL